MQKTTQATRLVKNSLIMIVLEKRGGVAKGASATSSASALQKESQLWKGDTFILILGGPRDVPMGHHAVQRKKRQVAH